MLAADTPPSGSLWLQILLSAVAVLGGGGGIAAMSAVLLQRRKFRADAADVITDTALTLVEPLKTRVRELEEETRRAGANVRELSDTVADLTSTMRRWRVAILHPTATVDDLRTMVRAESTRNGRTHKGRTH
jgi:hypothetical protein